MSDTKIRFLPLSPSPFILYMAHIKAQEPSKEEGMTQLILKEYMSGHRAGSVGKACKSWSQGCEFNQPNHLGAPNENYFK